jgi:MarR family transcriptional regulator, 2-MHQ and catechol-resistance regulon repressor
MKLLPLIRELVRTYQAFERYSAQHIRTMDITPAQFDVIVTLGNQPPMTCKTLGDKTLITKGTLTGVLDRLEAKGLINRVVNEKDARSQKIALTPQGETMFHDIFPRHKQHFEPVADQITEREIESMVQMLNKLRKLLKN